MKNLYNFFIGLISFYFIASIFDPIIGFKNSGGFSGQFISALLFGLLVSALPAILGFFKIKENNGALLLGGLVVNFLFYFLGYYLLKLFTISNTGRIIIFHNSIAINSNDIVLGLILISLFSSLVIILLQTLSKKR